VWYLERTSLEEVAADSEKLKTVWESHHWRTNMSWGVLCTYHIIKPLTQLVEEKQTIRWSTLSPSDSYWLLWRHWSTSTNSSMDRNYICMLTTLP
jgi:hypothetical protein